LQGHGPSTLSFAPGVGQPVAGGRDAFVASFAVKLHGAPVILGHAAAIFVHAAEVEAGGPEPAFAALLSLIERALSERPLFEPRAARRAFTLAAVDYGELVILPPLLARLAKEAPGIDIIVRQLSMETIDEQLETGAVDLAIGVLNEQDKPATFQQRLFQERFVCLVRADHPKVGASLTLEEFVALDHALISPRGRRGGYVEGELQKLGVSRRVALTVPHFLVAPIVVARSDLVLTVAARIAKSFEAMLPLRIVEPPLAVPGFSVTQFWHERQQQDPAHIWLRSLIMDVCRSL
jgi:DNA-binding transcriptional LysR family regulator